MDSETIQTLLDLLNPLHSELDKQTYDDNYAANFDRGSGAEQHVVITAKLERDLTQAVLILEGRLRECLTHQECPQCHGVGWIDCFPSETRTLCNG